MDIRKIKINSHIVKATLTDKTKKGYNLIKK